MILGLDISTICIGYTILDNNKLILTNYLYPVGNDLFEKIEFSINSLLPILKQYKIDKIFVEEPLVNIPQKSSIDTIKKLIRFNFGIIEQLYFNLKIKSVYIPASSAKRILKTKQIDLKEEELTKLVNVKLDKRQVFQYCLNTFSNFKSLINKPQNKYTRGKFKGLSKDCCFDCSDSVLIAACGELYVREIENS